MSAALIALAAQIGAPLVRSALERRIGAANAGLVTDVLSRIAQRAGVEPGALDALIERNQPIVVDAIRETETMMPELIALYAQGLEGQFALLQAEQKGPWWGWAWRPAFMWLLAFLWLWNIVILHVCNAVWRIALPPSDPGVLLSVTGIYAALYMGGHTVKDFVRMSRGGAA